MVCERGIGEPRYRAFPAFTCNMCGYSVCVECFARRPKLESTSIGEGGATASQQLGGSRASAACTLCDGGILEYDEIPVFEWTCEGPMGADWRRTMAKAKVMYDVRALQRYHYIRKQRVDRENASALSAKLVSSSTASSRHAANAAHPSRGPSVVEGSTFAFSVQNSGNSAELVWCGVSFTPRNGGVWNNNPKTTAATLWPLVRWQCPPSLEGVPDTTFTFKVPLGIVDSLRIDALQLRRVNDFVRAGGDNDSGDDDKPAARRQRNENGAVPAAGGSSGFSQPVITVGVLHCMTRHTVQDLPDDARREVLAMRQLVAMQATREISETPAVAKAALDAWWAKSETHRLNDTNPAAPAGWNEASSEMYHAVNNILLGRNTLVVGLGSKMHFLRRIHNACELAPVALHVIEGYLPKSVQTERMKAVTAAVRKYHKRARAAAVTQTSVSMSRQRASSMVDGDEESCLWDDMEANSQALDKLRNPTSGDGQQPGSGSTIRLLNEGHPVEMPINAVVGMSGITQETVINVPESMKKRMRGSQRRQCADWNLHQKVARSESLRQLVVVHNVDMLDGENLERLNNLLQDTEAKVTALCSADNPAWPAQPAAATLMNIAKFSFVQLRGAFVPRVMESAHAEWDVTIERDQMGLRQAGGGDAPLADTVRRVLKSLPPFYITTLRVIVDMQLELGVEVALGINDVMDRLSAARIAHQTHKMRVIVKELRSQRLAVELESTYSIRLVQPVLLDKVLREMEAPTA